MAERLGASWCATGDTVARLGGDEFMLLLPASTAPRTPSTVAQKILDVLRQPLRVDGHELHVTASIGISLFPHDGDDADTLVKQRRHRHVPGQGAGPQPLPALHPGHERDGPGAADARRAACATPSTPSEFVLHYQPQVDVGHRA